MIAKNTAVIATAAPWGEKCLDQLKQRGWTTVLSHGGIDALNCLTDRRPGVFVIDCLLADIDVQDVCEKLTIDPAHQGMKVLPIVDDRDSEISNRLQQMGLTTLEARADIASAVDSMVQEEQVAPSAALLQSNADMVAADQDSPAASSARPLILFVDDDRDLLRVLKLRFRSYDVDVETSTGGRQAVFKAIEIKPDVIVTDYSMPDGNAEYLIGQIREQPSLRQTPVIVLTGWTFEGGTDRAHQRDMTGRFGAVAYLQKPLIFDELVAQLQEHCNLRAHTPASHPLAS